MAIPFHTTTIQFDMPVNEDEAAAQDYAEPYEQPPDLSPGTSSTVELRAVIEAAPGSSEAQAGSERAIIRYRMICDPDDRLTHHKVITDTRTNEQFRVLWLTHMPDPLQGGGLFRGHIEAVLERVEGLV